MASKYTDTIYITSARLARGYVEAWLESETDTTATIGWKILCQQKSAALYGQTATCTVDGTKRGSCEGYITSSSSSWKDVCSKSGTTTVSKKSSARSVPVTIKTRVEPVDGYGSVTTDYESATVYVSVKAITYYAPNAPSGLTNTRESDNKNVLAWTAPSTSTTKPCLYIGVERQVDGGEWSQIGSIDGSATSYNDTTTSDDHSYKYRIRAWNSAGYSSYVTSGTTYNTPSAPTKVAAARTSETSVELTITNTSNTATGIEVQRSSDMETIIATLTAEGSPVTTLADNPEGGTFYYRARNTRDGLISAWSAWSDPVVTICAPDTPTLVAPASGVVVNKAAETITFEWKHNPIDGSAQTAAEVAYSLDNGSTWEVVAVSGNTASETITNAFDVNSTVVWRVRTKGVHEDYSPWSGNRLFYVYQAPSVAFAQPTDGFVVENTPIAVQLQYDDPSGTLANATLTVSDGSRNVYQRNMGIETECEIQNTEWLPDNGVTYTLTVAARSSSSLTASATREISVDFVLPQPALLYIENDPDTGYASLVVSLDNSEPEPVSITWDGDTTGLDCFVMSENDYETIAIYKVAEPIDATVEDFYGQTITVSSRGDDSIAVSETLTADSVLAMQGLLIFLMPQSGGGETVFAILAPTDDAASTLGLPSSGFYFYSVNPTETGKLGSYVSKITFPSSGYTETTSISVYRTHDGEQVLIGEGLQAGAGLVDKYAPLNSDFQYIVTSFADSGAANSMTFSNRIDSVWWFVYFGDSMAKAMWEPSGSRTPRRTKDELKERDGSEWPVLIQGKNKSHKVEFHGWVETKEEADAFEGMTFASGDKVYKGLKGEVFHCHAEADITDNYEYGEDDAEIKVSIARVRGGAL